MGSTTDSYGTGGVSTRYARPPLALRPCRVTRRPSLRSESSCGPCGTGLDGGVPAVDDFTPDAHPAASAWARRARSRGAGEAANAGAFRLGTHRPGALPTHTSFRRL